MNKINELEEEISKLKKESWDYQLDAMKLEQSNKLLIELTNHLQQRRDNELRRIAEKKAEFSQPFQDQSEVAIRLKINYLLTKAYNIRNYIELLELHLKYSEFSYNSPLVPIVPHHDVQEHHVYQSQFVYNQRRQIMEEIEELKYKHGKLIHLSDWWEKTGKDNDDYMVDPALWKKINEQN